MWEGMGVQKRYPPIDKELAEGSAPISFEWIKGFYDKAFERIIPKIKDDAYVVFHDAFRIDAWEEYLTQEKFKGKVILDTHQYLMVAEMLGCEHTLEAYRSSQLLYVLSVWHYLILIKNMIG